MIYPDKNKYLKLAGEYNLVPVYREYMADTETPTSIFLKSCGLDKKGFLLESIEGSKNLARYSFIGIGFSGSAVLEDGVFSYGPDKEPLQKRRTTAPLAEIEKIMGGYKLYQDPELDHFIGGAVGYLSYDLVKYFENISLPENEIMLPEMFLYFTDLVVVFDHLMNRLKIISTIKTGDGISPDESYELSVKRILELEKRIATNTISSLVNGFGSSGKDAAGEPDFKSNFSKVDFKRAVERAKTSITSGDAFQIVLSQRFCMEDCGDPINIYRGLRSINPSPYMYFFNFGDFNMIGASPEPLVKVNGNMVLTCPIAGTRKRGTNAAEEARLVEDLLNDKKEIAEHNMLVDLARNDLGRVCEYGSVKVKEYMNVEKYSHVMHLVSRVEGTLGSDSTVYDALRSVFPAGTLSGAPKIRAMQIISDLEPDRRGPYGGAVGYFGYDGNLDSCITIRTAIVKDGKVYVQAGAGIVYDSVPESEYQETLNKAAALLKAVRLLR
ncbi:MAG: anthranilate synthase component I [Actinomycetia bacterium]|nr:anthranilate synthase component I [Actinomycetes bacterium]